MKIIDGSKLVEMIQVAAEKAKDPSMYFLVGMVTGFITRMTEAEAYTECKKRIENMEKIIEDQAERIAIMEAEMPGWISVDEKLPDNAKHKGAFCPRYRVLTKWGETVGWYNPDKGWWYFLLWYTDGVGVDFEHGDDPKLAHEKNGAKVVTHWMPMQELPKEGAADE